MAIHLLDYMTIKAIKGPQPGKTVMRVADGGGLFLRVTKHTNKAGVERVSKSWELYFTMNSKTSCTGLGRFSEKDDGYGLTLDQARDQAAELRRLVQAGRNPVEERKPKASVVQNRVLRVDPDGNVLGPLPKFPALVVVDHGSDAEWEARLQKQQEDLITTAAASEIKHQAAIEAAQKE